MLGSHQCLTASAEVGTSLERRTKIVSWEAHSLLLFLMMELVPIDRDYLTCQQSNVFFCLLGLLRRKKMWNSQQKNEKKVVVDRGGSSAVPALGSDADDDG